MNRETPRPGRTVTTNGQVTDIETARRKRRERTGWTRDEVMRVAREESKRFREIARDEPDRLASGDLRSLDEDERLEDRETEQPDKRG
ncbi:MAG TPA: hypothetical protein VF457_08120 [Burkholderiaceae bacterium]